jgi:hypothetical protein
VFVPPISAARIVYRQKYVDVEERRDERRREGD